MDFKLCRDFKAMQGYWIAGCAFTALLCAIVGGARAVAEPAAVPTPPQLSSPSSKDNYEGFVGTLKGGELEMAAPDATADLTKPLVIKGNEGIPFPLPTEVVLEPLPTPVEEPTPTTVPTPTAWGRPGRCDQNKTVFEQGSADGDAQKIMYDLLFLSEDLIPLDPEEVFGAEVTLYPYGPTTGEAGEIWQRSNHVPCLPYRVRKTRQGYRYDFGYNALKNYSNDQRGKGVFHPWISEKLFGGPRGARQRR
jgi:hypothetical protein